MTENQYIDEEGVDRRAETYVTEHPGYVSSEQVTRDIAAERRLKMFQINRIIWTVLSVLEILLGLRFILKLIGANPASGFTIFIYGFSGLFTGPFTSLLGSPSFEGSVLEITTLIAMVVYLLLFWIIARVVEIVLDRPTARTFTRSTRHQSSSTTAGHPTHNIRDG
jgi:uncharacterized membrane protein